MSQNLVQQTEQKRYFLIERYKRKTSFSPTKLSPTLHRITTKQPFLLILDVFRDKKHFSETSKYVIGKKLLGSNGPYMSYPMKFTFYLHRAYGY